ncbi:MAG: hypothetical protein ABH811_00765 [archaeon]
MNNKNLIHLKLEHEEAIKAETIILSLERDSLRTAQIMKNYKILRLNELDTKIKLSTKLRSLIIDIRKLKKTLPKINLQKISEEEEKEKKKEKKETKKIKEKAKKYDEDIETQLQEIQNKLAELKEKNY